VKVEQLIQRDFGFSWSKPARLMDSTILLVSDNGKLVHVAKTGTKISHFATGVANATAIASKGETIVVGTSDGKLVLLDSVGAIIGAFPVNDGDTITDVVLISRDAWCVTINGVIARVSFASGVTSTHYKSMADRWATVLANDSFIVVAGYRGHVMRYSIINEHWSSMVLMDSTTIFCGALQGEIDVILAGDRATTYSSSDAGISWCEPKQVFRPYPFPNERDLASPDNFLHTCVVDDDTWVLTGDFYRS